MQMSIVVAKIVFFDETTKFFLRKMHFDAKLDIKYVHFVCQIAILELFLRFIEQHFLILIARTEMT